MKNFIIFLTLVLKLSTYTSYANNFSPIRNIEKPVYSDQINNKNQFKKIKDLPTYPKFSILKSKVAVSVIGAFYVYGFVKLKSKHDAKRKIFSEMQSYVPNVEVPKNDRGFSMLYRQASMRHHPDKGGDPEIMKKINNLKDLYDNL